MLRRRDIQRLALAIFAFAPACSSTPDQALEECFTIEDCPGAEICFLGSCVAPGYSIQSVHAELTPPANSPYLTQQTREPLDLRAGYQRLALSSSVTLSGNVLQTGEGLTGILIARAPGTIPGHRIVRQTPVSSSGYVLKVTPDTYDLEFVPSRVDDPDFPLPPISIANVELLSSTDADLPYPAAQDLLTLDGRLLYSTSVSTGVSGALITAQSETPGGRLTSSTALTDADGRYTLVLPPDTLAISIRVRPGDNPLVPETVTLVQRSAADPSELDDIVLGITNPDVRVSAVVRDENDVPIEDATILFEGIVGPLEGRFVATALSSATGVVQSESGGPVSVLPGEYRVTVVPLASEPYTLSATGLGTIETDQSGRILVVKNKVGVSGRIRDHGGHAVAGARIIFTLRELNLPPPMALGGEPPLARTYTVTTDSSGRYSVLVDRGEADNDAEYEVTVEPESHSALPRHRELLRVGTTAIDHDIDLFRASFIYGEVRDPGGARLAGVLLAFYSLELGSEGAPLLVGVAQTSTDGEFVVPLPTPD